MVKELMTPGAGARKTRRFLSQHCLEKLHHIGVELFMERCAVEARQAGADFLRTPCSMVTTRCGSRDGDDCRAGSALDQR
ncbi:hypothetical protein P3T23_009177 [Paraburkholderia sp. GAS448]|uniref:hypothetical protein n=1 Tax=Paraburkholderia sp. GAS448 TaxID=3035136 RepID=UPI003D215C4F